MKKTVAFLCISCLLIALLLGCAQNSAPTVTALSSATTAPTQAPDPPVEEPSTVTLHLITERITARKDGTPVYRTRASYDERGLITAVLHEDFSIPSQSYHYVYHYNDHGHLLYRADIENGKETNGSTPYSYTYNPDGTISSIVGYFEGNSSLDFEYDAHGRLLKATTTYYDGTAWPYATCQYNETGLLSAYTIKTKDKLTGYNYSYTDKFVYDEQNRLIRLDRSSHSIIIEYDQYGNLIREDDCHYTYSGPDGVIINAQNTREPGKRYFFDELGRLVRVEYGESYVEWSYQTIEVPVENLNMAITVYNNINEWLPITGIYNNIVKLLLPRPQHIIQ